jgi:hypothetical protein
MTSRPTIREVRRELVRLRVGRGATQERVSEVCPLSRQLPVVQDQQSRSAVPDADVALLEVLDCTTDVAIGNEDFRIVLRRTLNLGSTDWGSHLKARRDKAQAGVRISSPKTYARLEESAYIELASLLIRLDVTPCGADRALRRAFRRLASNEEESVSVSAEVTIPLQSLVSILLTEILSEDYVAALSWYVDSLYEVLPKLARETSLPAQGFGGLAALMETVLIAGLSASTDFDGLERLSDEQFLEAVRDHFASLVAGSWTRIKGPRLDAAIERLAALIAYCEESDLWDSLFTK